MFDQGDSLKRSFDPTDYTVIPIRFLILRYIIPDRTGSPIPPIEPGQSFKDKYQTNTYDDPIKLA
jgi:hypothetical protein